MRIRILGIFIIVAMLLAGCSAAKPSSTAGVAPEPARDAAGPMPEAPSIGKAEENSFSGGASAPQAEAQQTERLVIKNASLTIVVADPAASMDAIASMAESMNGFVVSSNATRTQTDSGREVPQAYITVRVPVDSLMQAIQAIKDQTADPKVDVLNDQITGDDVTQQYTDQKSRLRNLENAEAQLQEIMGSAKDTQDVLATYNQLVYVREQIEVLKGQIQYYEQAAALSAISVTILAEESVQPLSIGGWKPQGTARDAVQTLVDTLKFLGNAIIWVLLYIVPVVALLFVVVFLPLRLLFRWLRKNRAPRQPKITAPPAPQA